MVDLDQRLSPHFTLRELVRSDTAARHGIDNTPPDWAISALRALCINVLEPVRTLVAAPWSISSGYRCLKLNRLQKSNDDSQHALGEAADGEPFKHAMTNLEVARRIAASSIAFDQLILEYPVPGDPRAGWIHLSYRTKPRRQVLTIDAKSPRGRPGLP